MINYFNFKPFGENEYLITNDQGSFMFVSKKELGMLVRDEIDYDSDFGKEAVANGFCYDGSMQGFANALCHSTSLGKRYLFSPTSLHIFVVTNSCNMICKYCQARNGQSSPKGMMTQEVAVRAVDIALSTPTDRLSFEFQGGEPLMNFDVVRFIVEYAEKNKENKTIDYSLVSNLHYLNDEVVGFLKEHNISVSTSLDGPRILHDLNRPKRDGTSSYEDVVAGINKLNQAKIGVGAIETTTKFSLEKPIEIVDAYVQNGFDSIFIRPLTQLGCADITWPEIGYHSKEFIKFYNEAIDYILDLCRRGVNIKEGHMSIILPKILNGESVNYMELRSPCGAGIGQMAYYYDGNIYTCDEGRMLAEMGSDAFKLGNVFDDTYESIITCSNCKSACMSSFLESLPCCESCVYSPYCGTCPVINYAQNKSIFNREPNSYRCEIYKGIFDTAFRLIRDEETFEIIKHWV